MSNKINTETGGGGNTLLVRKNNNKLNLFLLSPILTTIVDEFTEIDINNERKDETQTGN